MSRRHSFSSSQRGYSLAEVLVAVAIFALIFIAALAVYDQSNKVFKRGVEAADTQQNVRVAFDKLVADLRMSGFDYDRDGIPTAAGGSPWVPSRTYGVGNMVVPPIANGFLYRMNNVIGVGTSCTSGGFQPPWGTPPSVGAFVIDNNCRWITLQGINQYQQPDEQIEYAHPSAITLRSNFDFELNQPGDAENGREPGLETPQFPVVTTGNDEIVTYALRSAKAGTLVHPNTDDIVFYVDTAVFTPAGGTPTNRAAYPSGRAGGENSVTVSNVNLGHTTDPANGCIPATPCFPDAPYTLYRFTLGANGTSVIEAPLATNIRSIRYEYYNNVTGVPAGTVPTGWSTTTQLTSPGGGQFNPAIVTQGLTERAARAAIRSVRMTITGMSEAAEADYQNPLETSTSPVRRYHTYRLESLIVPRNLGKQGMREIPPTPPGAPIIQDIIYGYCGAVTMSWLAPISAPGQGQVESYIIEWNTTGSTSVFPFVKDVGPNTSGTVTGLDPNITYTFTVEALNSFGRQIAVVPGTSTTAVISARPQNSTTPGSPNTVPASPGTGVAPGLLPAPPNPGGGFASGGAQAASPPAQVNQITVTWAPPTENNVQVNGTRKTAAGTTSAIALTPLYGEITRWQVFRSTNPTFTPDPTPVTGNMLSTAPPSPNTLSTSLAAVIFTDKTALNCVTYYYKVRAVEPCETNATCATCNIGGAIGYSVYYPLAGAAGIPGQSAAAAAPKKVATLTLTPQPPAPNMATWCNPTRCSDVYLRWSKVFTDDQTPAKPIIVSEYDIVREQYNLGSTTPDATVTLSYTDPAPTTGLYVDWVDTSNINIRDGAGDPITYRYYVIAKQCPLTPGPGFQFSSARSDALVFPCTFAAALPLVQVTLALDGDGMSPASAWLTNNPASVVRVDGVGLTSVQAVLESGGRLIDLGTVTGAGPTYNFPLVQTQIGELYTLYVIARDINGCATTVIRYVEEATPTGCCLANFDNDPSIVSYIPGTSFVDIIFRNLCSQNLDIQPLGVEFTWDPQIANNGTGTSTTINSVEFPSTGSGSAILSTAPLPDTAPAGDTTLHNLSMTPPSSTTPPAQTFVRGTSSNYAIRVNFNRILANANSPITKACVIYQRSGIDTSNQNCKIIPTPPVTFNSCN